jgi:hypothetical protein
MALTLLTLTVASHGLSVGHKIFIEGVNGFNGGLNNQTFTVLYVVDSNNFKIAANVSYSYQIGGRIHAYVSSFSGPSHLNGQTVAVVTNGQNVLSTTYNNGVILTTPAWNIVIGLPYTWTLKFLPLGGDGQTVNQGKERKLYDIVLRVWQSLGGKFGQDDDHLFDLPYTNPDNQLDLNISPDYNPLATGDIHGVGVDSQWDDYCMPVLTGSQPLPFMLLAAIMRSEISEDK